MAASALGATANSTSGTTSIGTTGTSPTPPGAALPSDPSTGPDDADPSIVTCVDRAMSETPLTSGGGSPGSLAGGLPMVSSTEPSTLKKKKSTLPCASPCTYSRAPGSR